MIRGQVLENESLRAWTTFKCSAMAALIAAPIDASDLKTLISAVSARKMDWRVLGRGSNLLVRDGGYKGVLVDLSAGFSKISLVSETDSQVEVHVGAGVSNGVLLSWLRERTCAGFGFSFGIPGSIGGGIRMNAGTPLGWFGQVIHKVDGFDSSGDSITLEVSDEDFSYRDFPKGHDIVITGGTFRFAKSNLASVDAEIQAAKQKRKNQPLDMPNIGSVFKNPPQDHAARLIEACGLKGKQIGEAQVSMKHANFIVNLGHAKTKDAMKLIEHVQKEVQERFDVKLEREVHIIGVDE